MKKLIYVSGGKGGIGKSITAVSIADYFAKSGSVLLIDADPTNADSFTPINTCKQDGVTAIRANIRSEDATGQIDTSGLTALFDNELVISVDTVIIDAPAGDTVLLASAGSFVIEICKALGAKSVFCWLVDSMDRAAVNTVGTAWNEIQGADQILMVKNHGKSNNFDFYEASETMAKIKSSPNVTSVDLPKIAIRLIENIKIDRMTWKKIAEETPIGNRVEGQRVRKLLHQSFEDAGL